MSANYQLLITGCGRSGTKYVSFILQKMGIDAPHERLGRDGIVSWTMAPPSEVRPFGPPTSQVTFDHTFHQVREPLETISSCATFNDESWDFICAHIDCPREAPILVRSALYWLLWNEKAEDIAEWRYRVEDIDGAVFAELCRRIGVSSAQLNRSIPTNFNTRKQGRLLHLAEEIFRRAGTVVPSTLQRLLSRTPTQAPLSWDALERADRTLCADVKRKAVFYGYEV